MSEPIGNFEGDLNEVTVVETDGEHHHLGKWGKEIVKKYYKTKAAIKGFVGEGKKERIHVDSRDVKLVQAFQDYVKSGRADHLEAL